VKHSNYRTADIYRLMIAETWGTTPNPFKLFALDIRETNTVSTLPSATLGGKQPEVARA
jgi:hypothetical protein